MIAETLACLLLILGMAVGLSRPFIGLFRLSPAEGLVGGAAAGLVTAWLIAWAVFAAGAPLSWYWLPIVLSLGALAIDRRRIASMLRDRDAADLFAGQCLVTGWCTGWLAFVRSHSGGAWLDDWLEHWQRALFFLRQWPTHELFISTYLLPARPPLANVLTAVLLQATRADYAQFQVAMAGLCSLAYLPVGLLALRFGGRRAVRVAAVLVMLSPLFMQNATYPWTKLSAAFFILAGLYFFLRVRDGGPGSTGAAYLCAVCLAGAVLTHYSAGPYAAAIAASWIATGLVRGWERRFILTTVGAAALGAALLAPWFLWSGAVYGWHDTFLSNSSVTSLNRWAGSHAAKVLLNLRDTLVPSQVRGFSGQLMRETSPWGSLRDNAFLLYQVNLPFALGSVGVFALAREAARMWRASASRDRMFWTLLITGFVVLGVAVYGDRERYGIAHICMASVVLLGISFIASCWDGLETAWKWALGAGLLVDFCLGIALQFAVEDYAIDRWLGPGRSLPEMAASYNVVAQANLTEKIIAHLAYFADILPTPPALVLALLGLILLLALLRAAPRRGAPE